MKSTPLRDAIHAGLFVPTLLAFAATPTASAQAQDDAEQLETITVVGSRIKRTDIETSQPVFVLEREDLQRTGLISVGDILQELTTAGATLNTTFNNAGNGETRADLRNLGSNRVLVLVNGRRWVQSASGGVVGTGVDLNTIPSTIIERVEVLKDGASAIYGSDAIAGVINITTRDNYDGAEATAYIGENEEGDGRTEAYDFTIGSSTDRASVVLNVAYQKQEPIDAADREITAVPVFGLPANNSGFAGGPSATTPFGRFGFGETGARLPNGAPGTLTLIQGRPGGNLADYKPFDTSTDAYNFAPDNYLLTPQERASFYAQARYDLTDTISFRTEILFNERKSEQLLAPANINLGTVGAGGAFGVNVSADNVYNPFGADITRTQFRPRTGGRSFNQDVDTFRFGGAFEGAFDLFGRNWSWDLGYVYGDTEENTADRGQYNISNIVLGVGPSFIAADGTPTCGTPESPIAGCVPLNLFGGPAGFTQAMADYVGIEIHDTSGFEMINYAANLTGDLFDLPAGPLGIAAGYEYRREEGFDRPDAFVASGNASTNARLPTEGLQTIDEFYVELNIPILADVPFVDMFEIALASRYSDYSTFGETTNSKFGFRWKPVDDLLVRGNWSEGFRAPNVSELFGGQADSFADLIDPCDAAVLANDPSTLAACRNGIGGIAGTPVGYEVSNSQIRITVGGNPELTPETAVTKTLGVVYSPSWLDGLDVYLDWYDIEIENTVFAGGQAVAQFLLDDCYRDGGLASCAQITRNPAAGDIVELLALNSNTGTLDQEGYDLMLTYRWDTELGRFRASWDSTYISVFTTEVPAGTPAASLVGNYFQFLPVWRLKSNIDLNWSFGDWGATLGARYLSALDESCATAAQIGFEDEVCANPDIDSVVFNGGPENELGDVWYWDVQATWDSPWNARITAGINNVLDEDPPLAISAFANTFDPQYDVPGRFWYVSYTQRF